MELQQGSTLGNLFLHEFYIGFVDIQSLLILDILAFVVKALEVAGMGSLFFSETVNINLQFLLCAEV